MHTYPIDFQLTVSHVHRTGAGHLHGRVLWIVAGRGVPGPAMSSLNDACLDQWAPELLGASELVDGQRWVIDEADQGYPAYVLERRGEELLLSVTASVAEPEMGLEWQGLGWNEVPCPFDRFALAARAFFEDALLLGEQDAAKRAERRERWLKVCKDVRRQIQGSTLVPFADERSQPPESS